MKPKDIWGWNIEVENIEDKTKTVILINNSKGCIYIDKEIDSIIKLFRNPNNKLTIYFEGSIK